LVLLKSIEHYNTGTGIEEVEEDPMTTVRAQEEKRRAKAKAKENQQWKQFF
jgi:hypothetical protein